MGFGEKSLRCRIVFFLLSLCFIIDLIEFAIPFLYATADRIGGANVKSYGGLTDICAESCVVKSDGSIIGNDLDDLSRVVLAFSILSWSFSFAALVVAIVFMFFMHGKKVLYLVSVCLSFAGGFCATIALAVYPWESTGIFNEYIFSFTLHWYINIYTCVLIICTKDGEAINDIILA